MARPKPVPPNLRVIEESAWMKRSKMIARFLRRNANAGIADLEDEFGSSSSTRRRQLLISTLPAGVNLMALPTMLIRI